jgi:hypothetical protein
VDDDDAAGLADVLGHGEEVNPGFNRINQFRTSFVD